MAKETGKVADCFCVQVGSLHRPRLFALLARLQFRDNAVALKLTFQIYPQRNRINRFVRPHPAPIEVERRAEFPALFARHVTPCRVNHRLAGVTVNVERQWSIAYKFPIDR